MNITPQEFTFESQGTTCAATLYCPSGNGPFPAILMSHGWGGIQDALTTPFYPKFLAAGYAVMTFDYRGWGKSEGEPRQVIDPLDREQDIEAALAHLGSMPDIDSRKIVLWGTSFGGGHAVCVAARTPSLLGLIAQVPMLNGIAAVTATPPSRLIRFGIYAGIDLLRRKNPLYIPVVSPPGEFSSMDRDDAHKAMQHALKVTGLSYDNRVAARSLLTMGPYAPHKVLKELKIRTLIVGATNDTVAPFNEQEIRGVNNPHIRIETLQANHFDPYLEPAFTTNIGYQIDFLQTLQGISSNRSSRDTPQGAAAVI